MGTALMMEGLLSACYHVCPNYTNFQFGEWPPPAPQHPQGTTHVPLTAVSPPDTSFMYMIAGLCMLKLYQKRHPDINASAYSAYACLALVIFFSVVGVVSAVGTEGQGLLGPPRAHCPPPLLALQVFGKGNTAFWIVFSVIHIVATLLLSTQLYYMGRWKLGEGGHQLGEEGGDSAVESRCHVPCPRRLGHRAQDPARSVHGLRSAVQRAHVRGECWHRAPALRGPLGSPPRAAPHSPPVLLQDRMVLLVMGNIINWSL